MCTSNDYAAMKAAQQATTDAQQYNTAVQKYDTTTVPKVKAESGAFISDEPHPSSKIAFIENFFEDFSWTHKNPEVAAKQAIKQFRNENLEAHLR